MEAKQNNKPKYYDIILTDIQIHTAMSRKPVSFGRAVSKAIDTDRPGRVHSKDIKAHSDGTMSFSLPLPKEVELQIKKAREAGMVVRFLVPKEGLPVYLGEDAIKKMQADQLKEKLKNKALDKLVDKYNM